MEISTLLYVLRGLAILAILVVLLGRWTTMIGPGPKKLGFRALLLLILFLAAGRIWQRSTDTGNLPAFGG